MLVWARGTVQFPNHPFKSVLVHPCEPGRAIVKYFFGYREAPTSNRVVMLKLGLALFPLKENDIAEGSSGSINAGGCFIVEFGDLFFVPFTVIQSRLDCNN